MKRNILEMLELYKEAQRTLKMRQRELVEEAHGYPTDFIAMMTDAEIIAVFRRHAKYVS